MEYKDYYKRLGVERAATPAEIRKAFRKLAGKFQPEVSKQTDASERMPEVTVVNPALLISPAFNQHPFLASWLIFSDDRTHWHVDPRGVIGEQ